MFKSVSKIELEVPAEIKSIKRIRDFITRIGKKHRLSDKDVNAFKLAADEASTNIIRHAYREKKGMITVRVIVRRENITLSLIDQGRFFDPQGVKDPDLKRYVAIGKRGGLGIMMIRKLVDEIDYRRTEEGNELRLTKNREKKKRRIMPSKAGSLRFRYYSVAAGIASTAVFVVYLYNYLTVEDNLVTTALQQMQSNASDLAANSADDLTAGESLQLLRKTDRFVQQNSDKVDFAIITNSGNRIQASSHPTQFIPVIHEFKLNNFIADYGNGIRLARMEVEKDSVKAILDYFVAQQPIVQSGNDSNERIGTAYVLSPAQPVFDQISGEKANIIKIFLIVLAGVNAGVGLLIILVFIPLQKLSNWVKTIDEGDIKDQIDIDTSDEIGEIAQAFSEITDKFRETQKSLVDQERIQQEMHLAKEIQRTLLPAEFPKIEGYEIASYYESAKEVGGDYYDFVEIDRQRMGLVVADVSGKGVPGSMVMTMIRTALRTEAKGRGSAAEVLSRVNDFIMGDIRKGMFVTLFYIILDSRRRRITFASAGHNPIILYRASTKKTYYLNPKGFPVGIVLAEKELFQKSIEDDTIQLGKGDIILCYTDGITEAMNSDRQLFGEERLLGVIREYGHLDAKHFVDKLKEEIFAFTQGQVQYDDISLVVIKENMHPDEAEFELAKQVHYQVLNGRSMTESCQSVGLPLSTFSQKYRTNFEEMGVDRFREDYETTSVEAKHLSIEEQTRIYDIIRKSPGYGPKRISQVLDTEEYAYSQIDPRRIYEELVRKRLNTRQLREAYVSRGDNKKRMKPPGTPMLTLDGQIIIEDHTKPKLSAPIDPVTAPKTQEKTETKADAKESKKKEKRKKTDLDQAEVSDLVLKDIVDLLDKGEPEEAEVKPADPAEDVTETPSEPVAPALAEADESETGKQEVDPEISKLLGDLEGVNVLEEIDDEALDFSDLSADEYSRELLEDQSNGDDDSVTQPRTSVQTDAQEAENPLSDEPAPAESMAAPEELDQESVAAVLNSLSIQDDNSEGEEALPASENEDFMDLVASESEFSPVSMSDSPGAESMGLAGDVADLAQSEPEADPEEIAVIAEQSAAESEERPELTSKLPAPEPEMEEMESAEPESVEETASPEQEGVEEEIESVGPDLVEEETAELRSVEEEVVVIEEILEDETEESEMTLSEAELEAEASEIVLESEESEPAPPPSDLDVHEILSADDSTDDDLNPESEETQADELLHEQLMDQSEADLEEEYPTKPEEVFEALSVQVETEQEGVVEEVTNSVQDESGDMFDLISNEEIQLEEEILTASDTNQVVTVQEKEPVRSENQQQKMLVAGGHYYMQKNYDKAIAVFQKIVNKYPSNIEAYYNLGNSYFRQNKWKEAENAYQQACGLDPTFLDAMENLGVIYANQLKFKMAIDVWSKIIELDPKRSDIRANIEKALKLSKEE